MEDIKKKALEVFADSFCRAGCCLVGFKGFAKEIYLKGFEAGFTEGHRQRLAAGTSGLFIDKFIIECCTLTTEGTVRAGVLFEQFLKWYSLHGGLEKITMTWFGRRLSTRFMKSKSNGLIFYKGVTLQNITGLPQDVSRSEIPPGKPRPSPLDGNP